MPQAPTSTAMMLLETAKRLAAVVVLGIVGLTALNLLAANPLVHSSSRCSIESVTSSMC